VQNGSAWTDEEDASLVLLRAQGVPLSQIGEKLGRSAAAAKRRAQRLGVQAPDTPQRWTPGEVARLVAMRRQGAGAQEIAQALGRSTWAVKRVITTAHATFDTNAWSPEDLAELVALRRAGVPRAEVAQRLGRTPAAVRHMIRLVRPTYCCRVCERELPPSSFAWSPKPGVPPCRDCHDRQARARVRLRGGGNASVDSGPPEPEVDIRLDRQGRLRQLERQFRRTGPGKWDASGYRMPSLEDWLTRFGEDPALMGRIIRDVILTVWWPSQPSHIGRRPAVTLGPLDILDHLPENLARLLLPDWGVHVRVTGGGHLTVRSSLRVTGGGDIAIRGSQARAQAQEQPAA
jgi:hypothetical protein